MPLFLDTCLKTAGRSSPLSQIQIVEVLDELRKFHPEIDFEVECLSTTGDNNLDVSLRGLDKTNFFTKEIDDLLLTGGCRIAIHSAKDLPDPIPKGLQIVALTAGVDSSDSLVLREGEVLKPGFLIATSSERREEAVKKLDPNVRFCDIRGTIQQRLQKLTSGEVDGVVIAEAALIRLGLTHLNRMTIPGETAHLQGKLAVLARIDDDEMRQLFSCIDTRTRCLYLGLELPPQPHDTLYTHFPVITTVPRDPQSTDIKKCFSQMTTFTHAIFTSKTAVRYFFLFLPHFNCSFDHLQMVAVGEQTAQELRRHGASKITTAENETAEGITELLDRMQLNNSYFLWPHSSRSRNIISGFLKSKGIRFAECSIYDTKKFQPKSAPNLDHFDTIYFTSPSTVDAFKQIFGSFPKDKELKAIGPITQESIELYCSLQ